MQPDFQEEWLTAYLDDELDDDQSEVVQQRLADDPSARQMLDDLKRVRQLVGNLPGWSGGDLQKQLSSVATLTPPTLADAVGDADEYVVPANRKKPIGRNSWRMWLGATALAASLFIVASVAWNSNFSGVNRSAIAIRTVEPASEAAVAENAQRTAKMRGNASDDFAATASAPDVSLSLSDSIEGSQRGGRPSEAKLYELSTELLIAPQANVGADGMGDPALTARSRTPAADSAVAALVPSVSDTEIMDSRKDDDFRQEKSGQLAMMPSTARFVRSPAWQEQEASLALPQVALLIAPAGTDVDSLARQLIEPMQTDEQLGRITEEKALEGTAAARQTDAYFGGEFSREQQQSPIALVQVEGGIEVVDALYGKIVTSNQLLPLQSPGDERPDPSLGASVDSSNARPNDEANANSLLTKNQSELAKQSKADGLVAAAPIQQGTSANERASKSEAAAAAPLPPPKSLEDRPALAEGLILGESNSESERSTTKEYFSQQGQSQLLPQQTAQKKSASQSATIVLFVTRAEAQQIIDSMPTVGKELDKRNAGKSTGQFNTAWWFLPAGIAANQVERPDDKVILLLNARP